jgi:transcriptional regulator with XRE-family HTH domain
VKEEFLYRAYSSEIIRTLVKRGYTLTGIASATGVTKSYISRVNAGTRGLTLEHLAKLEIAVGEPLPWLWLESIPMKSIPKDLRPLYRMTKKLIKPAQRRARRAKAAA